jgi:BolA family transcriptional regulator, general stress-responsive regulator
MSNESSRPARIRGELERTLAPEALELIDDSHLHAGHAGARDGRGHFRVYVVSEKFNGLRMLARHQLVFRSLGTLMQTDIHALSVIAQTPEEARAGKPSGAAQTGPTHRS